MLCRVCKIDQNSLAEFNDLAVKVLAEPVHVICNWHLSASLFLSVKTVVIKQEVTYAEIIFHSKQKFCKFAHI